jgi:putative ABC transport system permease protein
MLKLFQPIIIKNLEGSYRLNQYGMIKNYLKTSFRSLKTNKTNSLINIFGFGFAISICLAIALFVIKESSYDKYHENAEQIGRLINLSNNSSEFDYRVKDLLLENFPGTENVCMVNQEQSFVPVTIDKIPIDLNIKMSVDAAFFKMFTVPFIIGDPNNPFTDKNSVLLTQNSANRLFGNPSQAIGKTMRLKRQNITVTGVVEDFPENSSFSPDVILNAENERFKSGYRRVGSGGLDSERWPMKLYIQWNKNATPDVLADKINENQRLLAPYDLNPLDTTKTHRIGFLRLKDMYFNDSTTGSNTKKGNIELLRLFMAVGLIILILAIINYINLILAQQINRNKANGIKKTLGAGSQVIFFQFIVESLVIVMLAFTLGFFLLWAMVPIYNTLFQTTIDPGLFFQFPYIFITSVSVLAIGFLSGAGPAIVFSKIQPIKILSGASSDIKGKSLLRNTLTVFQFTTSMILIFCVLVVQQQVSFVKHKNPGFAEELLVRFQVSNLQKIDTIKMNSLLNELNNSPHIKGLSVSQGVPGYIGNWMSHDIPGADKMSIACILADTSFIKTFGLDIVKGRNMIPGEFGKVCLINEAAYMYFGFTDLGEKIFKYGQAGGYRVIGVVNDFNFSSFHNKIEPLCVILTPPSFASINLRLAENDIGRGLEFIEEKWAEFLPYSPIKYQFYDDWFDAQFQKEERFAKMIGLFAVLAIVISCIGILGLSIFIAESRSKEIAIRKVMGATIIQIMTFLKRDFVKWTLLAFLIACPIGYYVMSLWLENFAFKTDLSWWFFAISGLSAFGIAFATSTWHSLKAALANPVDSLRDE